MLDGGGAKNLILENNYDIKLLNGFLILPIERKVISMKDIADNQLVHEGDTIELQEFRIDINNYIFEREKLNYYNNQLRSRNLNLVLDSAQNDRMMYIDYQVAFYPNLLVNQIDFSFLNVIVYTSKSKQRWHDMGQGPPQGLSSLVEDPFHHLSKDLLGAHFDLGS